MSHGTAPICSECHELDVKLIRTVCRKCYNRHWDQGTHVSLPLQPRSFPPPPAEKPCARCEAVQSMDCFPRNNQRRDGRGSYCKRCVGEKRAIVLAARPKPPAPAEGMHVCRSCGGEKPIADFYWRKDNGAPAARCKPCYSERAREYHAANTQRRRAYILKTKYGISVEEFDAMVAAQGGGCAICGRLENPDSTNLAVDHCHTTGAVRGVLCGPCNKALGLLSDDPSLLERAVKYLKAV